MRLFAALIALGATLALGCTQRPRMCSTATECGSKAGCVAGRCLPDGGTPAIQAARRLVVPPVDAAFVRRGDGATDGALPRLFTLGREPDGDATLFLRFSVPLPKDASVVEAYVLLERDDAVDTDPAPIVLHAARIVEPWDGRTLSWAVQPRVEDVRAPSTTVIPSGRTTVRVDVRELVQRWQRHERADQGIAIVADNASRTGVAFALTVAGEASQGSPVASLGAGAATSEALRQGIEKMGPRLELYVK